MRTLAWFRSDLRTHDNTALHHASRDSTRGVVALFVVSPAEWRAHEVAPARVCLLLRSLAVLSKDLARLNIPLRVAHAPRPGDVPRAVADAARECRCDRVFFNKEYEVNESRRDEELARLCDRSKIAWRGFHDQSLIEPGRVRTGEGRFYTVFSPFRRAAYAWMESHALPAVLPAPGVQAPTGIDPSPLPASPEGFEPPEGAGAWEPGEHAARARLAEFVQRRIVSYKEDRDAPALDATSSLSPALAVGTISARQCLAAAMDANSAHKGGRRLGGGSEGIAHWMSELLWREFYIHILVGFPRVCMHRAFRLETERLAWSDNAEHLEAWRQGRTGVPIVDAGMRQLAQTGWMHNRVRMITAMYLAKNLFLDWRLGESWFMRHLVDGFLASNNGGWQWSASTGTDAAPFFRVMNPVSQSRRFDPRGEYVRRYVPELSGVEGPALHEPWTLPPRARARLDYPDAIVDLSSSRARAIAAFRALKGG